MAGKKIAVIGSMNMDMVVNVPYMPDVGETILGQGFKTVPGGKGANQAYAAAKLGGEVYILGKVGTDEFAKPLLKNLENAGVNTDGVKREDGIHTGLAFINVNKEGNNNIVVVGGANSLFSKDDLEQHIDIIEKCDIVLLQLEIPFETVSYAIDIAQKMKKTIILNPAPAPDCLSQDILKKIDLITPNEIELQKLTGRRTDTIDNIRIAARELISKGARTVIVTLGDKGNALATSDEFLVFPVPKVDVVDTTAAGDSFTAALAVALAEEMDVLDAIRFANKVATIVVTKEGAQTSIPDRDEVNKYDL